MLLNQTSTTNLLSTSLPNPSLQSGSLKDPLTTTGQTFVGSSQANRNIFTVTSLADTVNPNDGVTTLREAITAANNTPGTDLIQFAPNLAGTITLTNAVPLQLTGNITIQGLGANVLTINANHLTNPFLISQRATVNLSGLTIANGTSNTFAGGITNFGTLSLNSITLTGNQGGDAGGIDNFGRYCQLNRKVE
jgi:CSLREA domain-containing protein